MALWLAWLSVPAIPFVKTDEWQLHRVDWLTNFVSLEAIILSIAILVATRRKEEKDQARDDTQFTNTQVGVSQTLAILEKLERLEESITQSPVAPTGSQPAPVPTSGGGGGSGVPPASPAAP